MSSPDSTLVHHYNRTATCKARWSTGHCTLFAIPRPVHGIVHAASDAVCSSISDDLRSTGIPRRRMWSQLYQDVVVASIFSTVLTPRANMFIDLAANAAIGDSNSYYFDRCLGWRGICIEPNPNYGASHRQARNSTLYRECISNSSQEIIFGFTSIGQMGHILHAARTNETVRPLSERMRCKPLSRLLTPLGSPMHIDYLSLDVEGAELEVLKSVDFGTTSFTLMTVEDTTAAVHHFLRARRMVPAFCLFGDTLFVAETDAPAVRDWYARIGHAITIRESKGFRLLSTRIDDCLVPGKGRPPSNATTVFQWSVGDDG